MLASRFNLLSRHNDDATRNNAISTRHVALGPEAYGAFKVPGLPSGSWLTVQKIGIIVSG